MPTIADVIALPIATPFHGLRVQVATVGRDFTKTQKLFLKLDLNDATGVISSPVFDNVEQYDRFLKPGIVVEVDGIREAFNNKPQIRYKAIRPLAEGSYDLAEFIPAYAIPDADVAYFLDTVAGLAEPWKTLAEYAFGLGAYTFRDHLWKDFLQAPAAKTYHGNKLGGLFLHTVGVLRNVDAFLASPSYHPLIGEIVNADRLRFLAMFHDYGKMKDYVWKNGIGWNEDTLLDHRWAGIVAFEEIVEVMKVPLDYKDRQVVAYSLASHHGASGEKQPKSLEDWLLHLADCIDARVVEATDAFLAKGAATP